MLRTIAPNGATATKHRLMLFVVLLTFTCLSAQAATLRVPEDHKTIQAAVNAANSGDTVLVGAGVYQERVRLMPGIILRSAGDDTKGKLGLKRAEATIIDGGDAKGEGPGAGLRGPGVAMAEGSTLDGFTVTNVGTYDDAAWKKHHATQGEQQTYAHIGEPGIAGIGVPGVTCTIRNNIVHHIGYTGIGIMGAEGKRCSPLVTANICYRNMGGGIGSMMGSTAIIRANTCFENFYAGIGHSASSPLVIDNDCYGNVRAGIGISEGSRPIVRGNRCYKNRRAGIGIRTEPETQPIVEDNDCYENDMAGIGTRENAQPVIRNNRCYRNKLAGIGSRTGARPMIVGNECYENERAGIGQMSGVHSVITGNYSHHNKASGIGFAEGDSGESIVTNNRVIDNAMVAVGINAGWSVRLSGNELSRKGGLPPIVMVFNGATATFTGNTIRGEGVAGIRAGGTVRAVNNRFEGLALRKFGPPNFAVWALGGSDVTLANNRMSTWRHGLFADGAQVNVTGNQISNFHRSAIVIRNATKLANVFDNVGFSDDEAVKVLAIDGPQGVVENNIRKAEADN